MAVSEYDLMKLQELQDQIDAVVEKANKYRLEHNESRYFRDIDRDDDIAMRTFYENNYRILLNLTGQYEHQIELLGEFEQRKRKIEYDYGQQHGVKIGLILGAIVGVAIFVPLASVF